MSSAGGGGNGPAPGGAEATASLTAVLSQVTELCLPLVVDAARTLHGPTSVEAKLNWLLGVAASGAQADVALYASPADDVFACWPASPSSDCRERWASRWSQGVTDALGHEPVVQLDELGGLTSVLIVAVEGADGRPRGALVLGNGRPRPLGPPAVPVALALAAHLGVALDNTETVRRLRELEATQREVVHQLQDAVRPSTPTVADAELGVYYLAADPSEPTGGDLYDWRRLPDGDVHLAVVDVLGKGVAATKDALAVTHALRLLVLDGVPLADVVRRADEILTAHDPGLVATVIVGRYRPVTGELVIAGGGHPPALVIRAHGSAELVTAPGIPIGWPGAGSQEPALVTLGRSDTVVFYTDGLVESGKDILAGLDALVRAGEEVSDYPAQHLARALVHRAIAGGQRRDDIVAVVLRRRSVPSGDTRRPLPPLVHTFSGHMASVGLARHLLADWLALEPIDQTVVDDMLLLASELCANAVEANPGGQVVLRAMVEGQDLVVEVEDEGGNHPGVVRSDLEHPDPMLDRGRGLFLVAALSDTLEVASEGGRTVVRARKIAVASPGA